MNIEQFLSQSQSLDKLMHQYFSMPYSLKIEMLKKQQTSLVSSILLKISQKTVIKQQTPIFMQVYQQCIYQVEISNNDNQTVNKMGRLIGQIVTKASFVIKNIDIHYFVDQVLLFLYKHVFVTICSTQSIKTIWALVNAFNNVRPLKSNKNQMISEQLQNQQCSSSQKCIKECSKQICCKSSSRSSQKIGIQISQHQLICNSIIQNLLSSFKLHTKSYPFKSRKSIYLIINYVMVTIKMTNNLLVKCLNSSPQQKSLSIFLIDLKISKQNLIEMINRHLMDQKDPRNMKVVFQNYIILLELFSQDIQILQLHQQIFQNLQVYYPLSMENDQQEFKIDKEDQFQQKQLIILLDQCLLQDIFKQKVRLMLIEKMSAPPIHQYVNLYLKYITKYNPNSKSLGQNHEYTVSMGQQQMMQQNKRYQVLTLNMLVRLCQQQYLQQGYQQQSQQGSTVNKSSSLITLPYLINQILVCLLSSYPYKYSYEQKYIQFLNELIVNKLLNKEENNKHAGTIIQIVTSIINQNKNNAVYSQILQAFVLRKFMHFWAAKGEIAFKLGLLIIVLNKKLLTVQSNPPSAQLNQNLQLLLITLGNIYEQNIKNDQIRIIVIKILMIMSKIFNKLQQETFIKKINLNKIIKLNNNIIYNDSISIGNLLCLNKFNQDLTNTSTKLFQYSQPSILKSYVEFIIQLYFEYTIDQTILNKQIVSLFRDILIIQQPKQNNNDQILQILLLNKHFQIKIFAIVKYLSQYCKFTNNNQKDQSNQNILKPNQLVKYAAKIFCRILFSKNNDLIKNLISVLKSYKYQHLLSILNIIFLNLINLDQFIKQDSKYMFINLMHIRKLMTTKFSQNYNLEIQSQANLIDIVLKNITKKTNQNKQLPSIQILFLYVLRNIWIQQKAQLHRIQHYLIQDYKINYIKQASFRLNQTIQLQKPTLNSIILNHSQHQTTLIYIKHLKLTNNQSQAKFNKNLIDLYDSGMVEYFWRNIIKQIQNSLQHDNRIRQIIGNLLEFLPQKLFSLYAGKVLPLIIYNINNQSVQMINSQSIHNQPKMISQMVNVKSFDFSKTQLVSKIVKNLPQNQIIHHVLPFCLEYLKFASSQSRITEEQSQKTVDFVSIQSTLAVNKTIKYISTKIKQSNDKKKFEKLQKILDIHKKQIIFYYYRLIYSKKRLIRQSSRNILALFQ